MLKNNSKVFFSFASGIMCFLTFLCIALAVRNNIFRDSYVCLASITYIFGLIFLTVLSRILMTKIEKITEPVYYFMLFLLNAYIAVFFVALVSSIYKLPDHARQITMLYTLSGFFSMMIFLTLWLYLKQFLKESRMTRTVTALILAAVAAYTAVLIINIRRPVLFLITEQGERSGSVTDYISISIDFCCLTLMCIGTFCSDQSRNRRLSFFSCIFAPAVFVVLILNQEVFSRNLVFAGVVICVVLLPMSLIFFHINEELESDILRREKEQLQLQTAAMMSQMQPHFLYNSLAVIEALCEENPALAAKATSEFSDYLRENMDFADKLKPISFSEELNHIKTYVWLEKLRFPNRLNVEYDINCSSFPVPALSVQPMVENAIKHGVCKARSGGTVRISSFETDQSYNIMVSDDGTGFDASQMINDDRTHLGIENSRYRIREMVGGSLEIESHPGKGTTVSIIIPKSAGK